MSLKESGLLFSDTFIKGFESANNNPGEDLVDFVAHANRYEVTRGSTIGLRGDGDEDGLVDRFHSDVSSE